MPFVKCVSSFGNFSHSFGEKRQNVAGDVHLDADLNAELTASKTVWMDDIRSI